jgi:hypothetical protein
MNLYNKHNNPFESNSGSMRLANSKPIISIIFGLMLMLMFVINTKVIGLAMCVSSLFVIALVYKIFKNPKTGIYFLIVLGFFVTGAARYIIAPWGLAMDAILV